MEIILTGIAFYLFLTDLNLHNYISKLKIQIQEMTLQIQELKESSNTQTTFSNFKEAYRR